MTTTSQPGRQHIARAVRRTLLALTFATLTIAFLVEPQWVEGVTSAEPDGGSGALELGFAVLAGLVTLASSVGAGMAWRRVARAEV